MKPWSVRKSDYVVKDCWLSVRADECATAAGVVISPYYVLEYPDWVNVVVMDDRDQILITRQYRHGIGKVAVEIPCGCVEESDASPQAAVERELLEETGYGAEEFSLLGVFSPNAASHSNRVHCFLATGPKFLRAPENKPDEEIESEFVALGALMKLIDSGNFPQSIQAASIFLALRKAGKLSQVL